MLQSGALLLGAAPKLLTNAGVASTRKPVGRKKTFKVHAVDECWQGLEGSCA